MKGRTEGCKEAEFAALLLELQDHFGLKEQLLKDLREYQDRFGERLARHVDAIVARQEQAVQRLISLQLNEDPPAHPGAILQPGDGSLSLAQHVLPCVVSSDTPPGHSSNGGMVALQAGHGSDCGADKQAGASSDDAALQAGQTFDDSTLKPASAKRGSDLSSSWKDRKQASQPRSTRKSTTSASSHGSKFSKFTVFRSTTGSTVTRVLDANNLLVPKQLQCRLMNKAPKEAPPAAGCGIGSVTSGSVSECRELVSRGTHASLQSTPKQQIAKYEVPYFGNNCFEHAEEEKIMANITTDTPLCQRQRTSMFDTLWREPRKEVPRSVTQRLSQRIVDKHLFDFACALLMLTNAIFIGVEVEYAASNPASKRPLTLETIDSVYVVLFCLELVIRMAAEGVVKYFTSDVVLAWNWLDFIIVSVSAVELGVRLILGGKDEFLSNMRVVRAMRVLRMVRVVRIVRVLRFFRSLRMLLAAIFGTMKSGIWTAGLLCMIVYMFAVVFCQGASDRLILELENPTLTKEQHLALARYFGTLPRSLFTLWKAIIGGIDWEIAADCLSDVSSLHVALLIVFVAFIHLAVLNVVTGLFLHSAVEQAQSDQQDVIHDILSNKARYVHNLEQAFNFMDKSKDGLITLDEFELAINDRILKEFFASLDIQVSDAWTLFKLLDHDEGGGVDADEFIEGCCKLRGNARSLELAEMMYETRWMRDQVEKIQDFMAQNFIRMTECFATIEQRLILDQQLQTEQRTWEALREEPLQEEPEAEGPELSAGEKVEAKAKPESECLD